MQVKFMDPNTWQGGRGEREQHGSKMNAAEAPGKTLPGLKMTKKFHLVDSKNNRFFFAWSNSIGILCKYQGTIFSQI